MATSTLQIRVDSKLRREADALFDKAGLDMSSAVRLFLRQSVIRRRLPFEVISENPARPARVHRVNRARGGGSPRGGAAEWRHPTADIRQPGDNRQSTFDNQFIGRQPTPRCRKSVVVARLSAADCRMSIRPRRAPKTPLLSQTGPAGAPPSRLSAVLRCEHRHGALVGLLVRKADHVDVFWEDPHPRHVIPGENFDPGNVAAVGKPFEIVPARG